MTVHFGTGQFMKQKLEQFESQGLVSAVQSSWSGFSFDRSWIFSNDPERAWFPSAEYTGELLARET